MLAWLSIGCTKNEPEPACITAEVVGPDPCESGWFILKVLEDDMPNRNAGGNFKGQLESGLVTTDNLPAAYQQEGKIVSLGLELNGEDGPVCVAIHTMYPAVKVKRICKNE